MNRAAVLSTLLAMGALSLTVAAYQQQPAAGQQASKVVTVDKIKDNLYVLRGGPNNTTVFVTANGVVVVDTKTAGWGQPILSKIAELTPKPVTTVINTHSHFDHVSGNVAFPATVEIIAHENAKIYMEKWPPVYGTSGDQPNVFKESGGKGLPTKTFKDKMTVGSGADRVELRYFGRGHTSGDLFVLFPALRVLLTGDMFHDKAVPVLDKNAGGSGLAFPETDLKAYNAFKDDVDTVIPGHAKIQMTMQDLREYVEFTRALVNTIRDAKKAGKSAADVMNSWQTPKGYMGYQEPPHLQFVKSAAEIIFEELK